MIPRHRLKRTCVRLVPLLGFILYLIVFLKDDLFKYRQRHQWDTYRLNRYESYLQRGVKSGPGENGTAVVLDTLEQRIADEQMKNISYNVIAGNKVVLDRSIPDYRFKE